MKDKSLKNIERDILKNTFERYHQLIYWLYQNHIKVLEQWEDECCHGMRIMFAGREK